MSVNRILAPNGQPVNGRNGHARKELVDLRDAQRRRREVHATYDAARDTTDMMNYWANADALDADSANSKGVRARLVQRSRYEVANNGYADGLVQTHANYVIGTGPALRIQTKSSGFNSMVESAWQRWTKAVKLRRKLWCMAHAKVQDGEAFGIIRNNPRSGDLVDLDIVLIETEQCSTPSLPHMAIGKIDGIQFDEFGNPEFYDILKYHPGGTWYVGMDVEQVPARYVMHWYQLRRPGQHRGVPEFRSTLNVGASSRRWREATIAAAETAADYATILTTQMAPGEADPIAPLTEVNYDKRMMVAAPMGWQASQMKAEHPNALYDTFHRMQVNEQARPKSIPQNLAMCDSSGYNFASGKLDHGTYFLTVDMEREDANDCALDKLFSLWFQRAALVYGWSVDPTPEPPHTWDWPQHPVGDIKAQAFARDMNLKNGTTTLSEIYSNDGLDFEDQVNVMASDYGVTADEMRARLFEVNFSSKPAQQQSNATDPQDFQQQLQDEGVSVA